MSSSPLSRAHLIIVTVLIGLISLIGLLGWDRINTARQARHWTQHTYEVLATIGQLRLAMQAAEDGERGFLLTAADADLAGYEAAASRSAAVLGELQRQTADNNAQQRRIGALAPAWQRRLAQLARLIALRRERGLEAAAAAEDVADARTTKSAVAERLAGITAAEQRLLAERLGEQDARGTWLRRLLVLGVLVAVGGLALAFRLNRLAWARSAAAEHRQRTLAGRLQTALDSLSQGIGVFGPAGRLRHWNERFGDLLDAPAALLCEGTPYGRLVEATAHDGRPRLETPQQIALGREPAGGSVAYETAGTTPRVLELRRTPTSEGGFVLTVSDMTERAAAEALLRDAQKMQAIGQLTGGLAHDFNNLLTVMTGNLELGRAKLEAGHPLIANLDRCLWAAQRGSTLTGQLLAFARKQPLAPAAIDLSATLPGMVPLLRRTLGETIDVRFVDSAGLWPAMADPAQVESAVLNLALNARDAMPAGGRLTIELANKVLDADFARRHADVAAGDYVMVAVSDTGQGMTPDIVARVFEPFFTTKPDGRGTGLGLAMVFGFVKQSGGHVTIDSKPGEGTAMKLYLPRAAGGSPAVAQKSDAPAALPHGGATILVVEDETGVREVAAALLRSLGYRVLQARNGDDALLVFAAHAAEIDLLLTDVVLPGTVRGRELAQRIVAARPAVKILLMSGYTENAVARHGRPNDGVPLLGKPFNREQLARKVAEILHLRRIEEGNAGAAGGIAEEQATARGHRGAARAGHRPPEVASAGRPVFGADPPPLEPVSAGDLRIGFGGADPPSTVGGAAAGEPAGIGVRPAPRGRAAGPALPTTADVA